MKKASKYKLFRRHFLLISLTTLFLVLLLLFAHRLSFDYQREQLLPPHVHQIIDSVNSTAKESRAEFVEKINKNRREGRDSRRFKDGGKLKRKHQAKNFYYLTNIEMLSMAEKEKWESFQLPKEIGDHTLLNRKNGKAFLILLEDNDYLLIEVRKPPFLFPSFVLFIIGAILVAAGISSILYYHLFSKMSDILEDVISKIKAGDLKARLEIDSKNEIGETKQKFNVMADEIEKLVTQIQATEASRLKVLQQLAHDLRTPIASQKNLLETLKDKNDKLDNNLKLEFLDLAIKESFYFERLVEDLLFLAMLVEPHYASSTSKVDLNLLSKDLLKGYQLNEDVVEKSLRLEVASHLDSAVVSADPHHLERLMRNLLNNAVSFAKSKVVITIKRQDGKLFLSVEDDGMGFDEQSLENYGVKKFSRVEKNQNRLSIGLGSVIVKAICEKLNAVLIVENKVNDHGSVTGAKVQIQFKS